jgi:ACS family hexuronate transporter-like MFS transporter
MNQNHNPRRALVTVTLLAFALNLVNYLDRAVIGSAASQIITEFDLTNSQFGWLTSSFGIGCIISNSLSGFIIDRIGVKYIWTLAIVCWSISMLAQAYVKSYPIFICLRLLMGVAEGINFSAMDRAHSDHWYRVSSSSATSTGTSATGTSTGTSTSKAYSHRNLTFSISLLGVFLAFVIGYPLFGITIPTYGWRSTFIGLAILGFVSALLFLVLYPKEQEQEEQQDDENDNTDTITNKKQTSNGIPLLEEMKILLKDKSLLSVCWSFGTFGYVLTMAAVWFPNYLKGAHSIDLRGISIMAIAPFVLASVLCVVVALISDQLYVKYKNNRISQIYPIAICQFLSMISFIPLLFNTGASTNTVATTATVCTILGIGIGLSNNAPYYTFCATRFPKYAGQATGIMIAFFSLGSVLSPFVTGYIIDATGSFAAAFGVVVGLLASSVIVLLLFAFPDKEQVIVPSLSLSSGEKEYTTDVVIEVHV